MSVGENGELGWTGGGGEGGRRKGVGGKRGGGGGGGGKSERMKRLWVQVGEGRKVSVWINKYQGEER